MLSNIPTSGNAEAGVTFNPQNYNPKYIYWSYDATPTGGLVFIRQNDTNIFEVDVTQSGPGFLPMPEENFDQNSQITIGVAAAGSGIIGKIGVV